MTTPSINASINPAIDVLAKCLSRTSENYQQLLNQPESYAQCTEAGRSLRYLSERYAQVVLAVWALLLHRLLLNGCSLNASSVLPLFSGLSDRGSHNGPWFEYRCGRLTDGWC